MMLMGPSRSSSGPSFDPSRPSTGPWDTPSLPAIPGATPNSPSPPGGRTIAEVIGGVDWLTLSLAAIVVLLLGFAIGKLAAARRAQDLSDRVLNPATLEAASAASYGASGDAAAVVRTYSVTLRRPTAAWGSPPRGDADADAQARTSGGAGAQLVPFGTQIFTCSRRMGNASSATTPTGASSTSSTSATPAAPPKFAASLAIASYQPGSVAWLALAPTPDARRLYEDVANDRVHHLMLSGVIVRVWAPPPPSDAAAEASTGSPGGTGSQSIRLMVARTDGVGAVHSEESAAAAECASPVAMAAASPLGPAASPRSWDDLRKILRIPPADPAAQRVHIWAT